jgi:HK97 family phage portal protein
VAVWDWFLSLFDRDTGTIDLNAIIGELSGEIFFKELAIQSCINLIANVLSKAEFQTFEKGKEVRKDNYYLFNVEPNPNKSASKFWRDVVHHLVYDNECLVIQQGGYFYVADSFTCKKFAFREYLYDGIEIDGYHLSVMYNESQVMHFELHNERIKKVIDGLYQSYGKLIAAAQGNYKRNNSPRGTLKISTSYPQTEKGQRELQSLFDEKFKKFFEAEGGAVLPLQEGLDYTELASNIGVKGGADNKEIRAFIDDIFDFVCIAFNIPPQLIKGAVADTEKAVDNLLTFCINPLAETLQDEVNRKYYGKADFLARTYLKINTSMIRVHDLKSISGALETLLRIGAYTVDDCLKTLGMEPLNTEWSTARFMTKNYAGIESVLAGATGDPIDDG